jgi:small subunit ribosomal protein S8
MPTSRIKAGVARVLKDEGYISDFRESGEEGVKPLLRVYLKYGPDDEMVIRSIQRVSRPSRRVYSRCADLRPVLHGMGISILSTNQGILSDREARERNVGGEVLAEVW